VQQDGSDPLFAADDEALQALEALLDGLPGASEDFGSRVEENLWPQPAPEDLKALSKIVGERHLVPRGAGRRALLRGIVLRRRIESMRDGSRSITADRDVLEARAQQWERLAEAARSIREELPETGPTDPVTAVVEAGQTLIGSPAVLDGEAALTRGAADLIDGEHNAGPRLAALIPESLEVIEGFRHGHLPPSHAPLVEVAAGILIMDTDLRAGDRNALQRDRKLIERLLVTLDRGIEELMPAHTRVPETNAWLAAWRRRTLDLRVRIDEWLTRPAPEPEQPSGAGTGDQAAQKDEAVVDRLRQLRSKEEEKESADERRGGGVLGWLRRLGNG
jgi:hypothetical protein